MLEYPNKYSLQLKIQGKLRNKRIQRITNTQKQDIEATFLTLSGNMVWMSVHKPIEFFTLIVSRPINNKACENQFLVFMPKGYLNRTLQAAALLFGLFKNDRKVLNHVSFSGNFTENDEIFREFVALVNKLPVG